jgi:lysozyme family protein
MADNFPLFISRVLGHEGKYVNNPLDPGGATNWGITSRTAAKWGYKGEMRFLPRETAVEIYKNEYWETPRCDGLPPPLAFQVFDAAVNHGPIQAIKWLQHALSVEDDGIIGPKTLAAANGAPGPLFIGLSFLTERTRFYTKLPTWPAFGRGWIERVCSNLEYLQKDCDVPPP